MLVIVVAAGAVFTFRNKGRKSLIIFNSQLGDEADSDTSKYVEASVDGRVKKIYASKNTEVANTVLEQGALILLSLDGKMVVKMETSVNLTVGQTRQRKRNQ